MPPVIAAVVAFVASYYVVIEAVVTIAAYAYNRQQAIKAQRAMAAMQNHTMMIKQPAAARTIVYGRGRVGGVLTFAQTAGTNNEKLYIVVCHAGHECDAIEEFYLNNDKVTLDGSGNVVSAVDVYGASVTRYNGNVVWKYHLGAAGQTVDSFLQSEIGSSVWPSTAVGNSVCYSVLKLTYSASSFSAGMPNVSVVLRGKKVYDPRSATTAWSQNSALCVRDFLTDANIGFGCASGEIDDTACNVAANHCDEAVALLAGGTESRYTCNGVADTSTAPGSVLADLCGSMDGSCSYVGGLFTIRAGCYVTPTVTLSETDLRGPIQIATRDSMRDVCNAVKGVYVSAKNHYQPADFPPVASSTYATQDGGVFWRDIQLPFTSSPPTAQRLALITLLRGRNDITVTFPAKMTALNVLVGDTIMLNLPRYGFTGAQVFEVKNSTLVSATDGGGPALGVDLALRLTTSTIWSWTTANEIAVNTASRSSLYNPFGTGPTTPTGLAAVSAAGSVALGWSKNPEADFDHYDLYRNTSNTFAGATKLWYGYATAYIDPNVSVGTTYYYFLVAVNSAGYGSSATSGASGTPGSASSYWLTALGAMRVNISGVFTPTTITPNANYQTGAGVPTAYNGRFTIEDSPDGSTWTTRYTSSSDESSHTFTPTAGTVLIRIKLYLAGGITNLVDEQLVPVAKDGATGATGATGAAGANGTLITPPYFTAEPIGNPGNIGGVNDELAMWGNVSGQTIHYRRQGSSSAFTAVVVTSPLHYNIAMITAPKYAYYWEAYLTDGSGGVSAIVASSYNTCN